MALKVTKTEMTGTGGGRWMTRNEAKTGSKTARRANDKAAVVEEEEESFADRHAREMAEKDTNDALAEDAEDARRECLRNNW